MKKNLYFRTVFQRKNIFKEILFDIFMDIASLPRFVIEVFIRKNMGRRYYRPSFAILTAIFLIALPFIVDAFTSSFSRSFGYRHQEGFWDVIKNHWLWYIFIIAFCYFSFQRYKDMKRIQSLFDMNHFSLSSGDTHPFYYSLKFKGKAISPRALEIYVEPLSVFIVGFFLNLIGQGFLGWFLMICAVIYGISYAGAYMRADNFILNKIDEIICNEQLSNTFVKDEEPTKGFRFYGEKPSSEELRKDVFDAMFEQEDEFTRAR